MADSATGTISAEKLCALTGLTDRRHRQLAKEGLFPPPINGQYQLGPTIAGLFKHYREQQAKKGGLAADKTIEEIRRIKIHNDREERKLIHADKEAEWLFEIVSGAMSILHTKLVNEYPAIVSGLDTPQCRIKGRELYDITIRKLRLLIRPEKHVEKLNKLDNLVRQGGEGA